MKTRLAAALAGIAMALTATGLLVPASPAGGDQAGPSGFDCSGLVYAAYRAAGITLPRTTYGMLASAKLIPVAHPRRGDLAFYGPGHVEFWYSARRTYGALEPGTVIESHHWFPGSWWVPSGYFRVRGAG